ncbi:MAG: hypothetical protein QOG51_62 [Verrucomicrobiota bacterium]|jgi:hypothetical protein
MLTSLTKAAVVERMPKMKFIEAPQEIELVVWRRVYLGHAKEDGKAPAKGQSGGELSRLSVKFRSFSAAK